MAMPMEEAHRRCGSLVSAWLITQKTTSPARRYLSPSFLEMILQPGGKMLLTRTMLKCAIPASRSAISNELSFSRCRPTPLVRKIFFDTNIATLVRTNVEVLAVGDVYSTKASRSGRAIGRGGKVSTGGRSAPPGVLPGDLQDGAAQRLVRDALRPGCRRAAIGIGDLH